MLIRAQRSVPELVNRDHFGNPEVADYVIEGSRGVEQGIYAARAGGNHT
jgi:hypothetical protein